MTFCFKGVVAVMTSHAPPHMAVNTQTRTCRVWLKPVELDTVLASGSTMGRKRPNNKIKRTFEGSLKQEQRTSTWSLKKAFVSVLNHGSASSADGSAESRLACSFVQPSPIARSSTDSKDRRSRESERDNSSTTGDYIHRINNDFTCKCI